LPPEEDPDFAGFLGRTPIDLGSDLIEAVRAVAVTAMGPAKSKSVWPATT
jgi:hypothetical protein